MQTILYNNNSFKESIDYIENELNNGGIGIFPTDTVYGIGCNAFNETAIKKIYKLKSRDYTKPISVLISNFDMLNSLVDKITIEEKKLINAFWPGALTIIFQKKDTVPNILTSNLNTLGIRMPNNSISLDLINKVNVPIATTSANISGKSAGVKLLDFYDYFNNKVNFIIDGGNSTIGKASTVVQVINGLPHILREGSITKEQIINVL